MGRKAGGGVETYLIKFVIDVVSQETRTPFTQFLSFIIFKFTGLLHPFVIKVPEEQGDILITLRI